MESTRKYVGISQEEFGRLLTALRNAQAGTSAQLDFERLVDQFTDMQKRQLASIVWLGRGDLRDWREIFEEKCEPVSTQYLVEKRNILVYLMDGWDRIPNSAKCATREEYNEYYREFVNPVKVEPTTQILDAILRAVEAVSSQMDRYVHSLDERLEADREILLIFHHADMIDSYVAAKGDELKPWYGEKAEALRRAAKDLVGTWLMDPATLPDRRYGDLSRDEWIRERLDGGLSGVHRYSNTLREAVIEDGMNLLPSGR